MTKKTKLLLVLIALSAGLGLHTKALSQSRSTATLPNQGPRVELVASTNPIFIDDVVFDGLQAITTSGVEDVFRQNLVGLSRGAVLVPAHVEKGRKILTQILVDFGFVNARVQSSIESVSARSRRITFKVNEGPPAVIRDIQFEGNKVFTDDELLSKLELVSVMSHDVYNRNTLDYDLFNPRDFMRSRGYLQAKFVEPKLNAVNGNLTIIIPVEEGKLYRIGKITVLNSKRLSADQIVELVGLKKGDIANEKRISDFLSEELKHLYGNMGYFQYLAEPDSTFIDNPQVETEGIVDIAITINEGACYKIDSIEFDGNKKLTSQQLRSLLLFKEGDTYNRQLIQESIKSMSESGIVQPIKFENDVYFNPDEETGLIGITIAVAEAKDQ